MALIHSATTMVRHMKILHRTVKILCTKWAVKSQIYNTRYWIC